MNISSTKKISEALSHLSNENVQDIVSLRTRVLDKFTQKAKNEVSAILKQFSEDEVDQQLEDYLGALWIQIRGTTLCYTAIPHAEVTQCLCLIADILHHSCLSTDTEAPKTPLEYLMPSIQLESNHAKYPDLLSISPTRLSDSEERHYTELQGLEREGNFLPEHCLSEEESTQLQTWHTLSSKEELSSEENALFEGLKIKERNTTHKNAWIALSYKKSTQEWQQTKFRQEGDWLVVNATLINLMDSHILSDTGQCLIPVDLILDDSPINPYDETYARLSDKEMERLIKHSPETLAVDHARDELSKLTQNPKHFLGHLSALCVKLAISGAHEGVGKQEDAAMKAYPALLEFYTYYNQLEPSEKDKIPSTLRNEIDMLLNLSSTRAAGAKAVDLLQTCIATRQEKIAKCIQGHEPLLSTISCSERTMAELIKHAQENLVTAKNDLQKALLDRSYVGTDQLPLTKRILETLHVKVSIRKEEDLTYLLQLSKEEFIEIVGDKKEQLVNIIPNIESLVLLIHNIPVPQLEAYFSVTRPHLMKTLCHDMTDALSILSSLDSKKFDLLLNELILHNFPFWKLETCFTYFQDQPEMSSKIINRLPISNRLNYAAIAGLTDVIAPLLALNDENKPNAQAIVWALGSAIKGGKSEVVAQLLAFTGDNKLHQRDIVSALMTAAAGGKLKIVIQLLSLENKREPNQVAVSMALRYRINGVRVN